jgi:hypothetical protein
VGAEIWLGRHIGLAPELALDGGPFISQHTSGVTTGVFVFSRGCACCSALGVAMPSSCGGWADGAVPLVGATESKRKYEHPVVGGRDRATKPMVALEL